MGNRRCARFGHFGRWVPDEDPVQQTLFFENNDFAKSGIVGQLNVLNGVGAWICRPYQTLSVRW